MNRTKVVSYGLHVQMIILRIDMQYKDLSRYTRSNKEKLNNVINIGWLNGSKYKVGIVSEEVLSKLKLIYKGNNKYSSEVNLLRGPSEKCKLCNELIQEIGPGGGISELGCSEIWIKKNDRIYASPSLIIHYIEEHKYQPPFEYVKAVLEVDLNNQFNAQQEKMSMLLNGTREDKKKRRYFDFWKVKS